jgi:hypothetical protein
MSIDAELYDRMLLDSQVETAQNVVNSLIQKGISAKEFVSMLNRDSFQPLLDKILVGVGPMFVTNVPFSDDTGEPVIKTKARKAEVFENNRATIRGGKKRKFVTFTPEQKASQKELIYKTVANNEKTITTPQIIKKVIDHYPQINESVVRDMIKDLARNKHLQTHRLAGSKTKAIHYSIGPQPF